VSVLIVVELYAKRADGTLADVQSADLFEVWCGEPNNPYWLADFAHYTDAYNWACQVALAHEAKFVDHSGGLPVTTTVRLS
jgi:hypothetical protein